MLQRYFDQLRRLSELLSQGRKMDFALWKEAMKLTAVIILQSIGFLVALALIVAIPVVAYKQLRKHYNKKITVSDSDKVLREWTVAQIIYWVCLVVLYIPFSIPTVLLFL